MATNYVQPGATLTLTAAAAVTSGTAYKIGQLLVVALTSAAIGGQYEAATEGVFTLPATAADAWGVGDVLYWDPVGLALTDVGGVGVHRCGVATAAKLAAATSAPVKLNGFATPDGI